MAHVVLQPRHACQGLGDGGRHRQVRPPQGGTQTRGGLGGRIGADAIMRMANDAIVCNNTRQPTVFGCVVLLCFVLDGGDGVMVWSLKLRKNCLLKGVKTSELFQQKNLHLNDEYACTSWTTISSPPPY